MRSLLGLLGHLTPAIVAEVVDSREEFPHQDHPGVPAPLRQDNVRGPPGKCAGQERGKKLGPQEAQESPFVFPAKLGCIQAGPEELHQKIITDLVSDGKDAGSGQRQFAPVELGDVAGNVEGVGIAGPVQVTDGSAAETCVFVVIDDVFVDHGLTFREAPCR